MVRDFLLYYGPRTYCFVEIIIFLLLEHISQVSQGLGILKKNLHALKTCENQDLIWVLELGVAKWFNSGHYKISTM